MLNAECNGSQDFCAEDPLPREITDFFCHIYIVWKSCVIILVKQPQKKITIRKFLIKTAVKVQCLVFSFTEHFTCVDREPQQGADTSIA